MENKKIIKLITFLIIIQPIFDVLIYFTNRVLSINTLLISLIRPSIATVIYIMLLFNVNVNVKDKKKTFIYLIIYAIYCILHLLNIKNNFFSLSYGNMMNEIRYLCNYGYFIMQFFNFYIIFKIANEKEKKEILVSLAYAYLFMTLLYIMAVITKTSPKTYIYSLGKQGWKGWSISAHYIGHSIIYGLPVMIYALFEKKYIEKWYKYIIFTLMIIPPFYLVGTKASLFATLVIVLFYTFIRICENIKKKKINIETIYFIVLSMALVLSFKYTFGYDNFKRQVGATNQNKTGVNLISDNLKDTSKYDKYNESLEKIDYTRPFEDRMIVTLYKYRNIKSSVFDNRTIQKTLNRYLWKISPVKDKLLGYGHDVMPNCTWVETDIHTIFYCYGIIGFILIIIIPIGYVAKNGLICLLHYKKLDNEKLILGFGFAISLFIIYSVGYTMQFAQTIFYFIILLNICNQKFKDNLEDKEERDYLFAINDLNIGGAEVGMIDVVNELASNGNKVDIALLRKEGPLLEKLNSNINVYSVIDKKKNFLRNKVYYIMYMLGKPFSKFIYKRVIKNKYKYEIAYLEGYPAVFVTSSNNPESIKIASIRVGLKSHKLKASKLPWGEYQVKKAYQKIDNIYTVSKLTTKEFIDKYPFCKEKTKTIYTYFNVEDIRRKSLEKYDYKYDKKKINFLAVGRFNEQKSYDRLIKAFAKIAKKHNNVLLHFIGKYDTEEGKEVIALIKEYKLDHRVILHGIKNNPYPYIKDCDCLISSSLYEGFPRVINEALCLGKICIGTNVTGTKEALHEGKLGILVENSIEGLIKGMDKFINNKDIYKEYKDEINKFDGNKKSYFEGLESLTKKKKSMIIYMPKLSFGGMEKSLVNLINYTKLNEKYYLTLYLLYKGDMNYIDLLPKNINLIIANKGKWNLLGKMNGTIKLVFRYVYQIFKNYDIAISYSYQHPILNSLTRLSSKNSIIYIHSNISEASSKKDIKKILKRCKYERFNKIICVSENSKQALEKLINRKDKIYVVNNIIDGDRIIELSNEKVEDFKFQKDKVYFINIARHTEIYKKITRIINATEKLNKEGYKFEVLLIGDGEDHKLYSQMIKELHIDNIQLLGKKKNPYKYLKYSSALLLSSIREGYPVVFIESMILNKPIVTTNISDAKKDIEGKYGIVVNNDEDSIYNGMKEFMDNGFKIKKEFDYLEFNNNIIKEIEKIYNEE